MFQTTGWAWSWFALILGGCAGTPTEPVLSHLGKSIAVENRPQNATVERGIKAIAEKKYSEANEAFNEALRLEPGNAGFHYLNALTYHLRAERGETGLLESAETGYQVALRLDPRQYWAAAQLAQIRMKQKRYSEAADKFSHALLFESEDPSLWHSLSAAAYYAHDLNTANSAIRRAERLAPDNTSIRKSSVIIKAASGDEQTAAGNLGKIREDLKNDLDIARIEKRLRDWDTVHRRVAVGPKNSAHDADSDDEEDDESTKRKPATASQASVAKAPTPGDSGGKQMCTIDVVMIQSVENRSTRKGMNLLNGLQAEFNGSGTFGSTFNKTSNDPTNGTNAVSTDTQSITSTISIPAVKYNLNIFNDGTDRNEILARPTLVALDGESSEFFSGGTLKVGLQGVAGSQGTVQDLPVGVKLKVTPFFLPNDKVKLTVETSRESPDLVVTSSTFQQSMQTSKTTVLANVVMNFMDTLVLSGLADKETSLVRDGVPLLKELPLIQYFFSSERKVDSTKSVLVLLTPRKEHYTHEKPGWTPESDDPRVSASNLSRLKKKYDWFKPEQNLTAFLRVLDNTDYFTEFRTGDIVMESWDTSDSLGKRLRHALDFLYY